VWIVSSTTSRFRSIRARFGPVMGAHSESALAGLSLPAYACRNPR